jgi:hypothetical protein
MLAYDPVWTDDDKAILTKSGIEIETTNLVSPLCQCQALADNDKSVRQVPSRSQSVVLDVPAPLPKSSLR